MLRILYLLAGLLCSSALYAQDLFTLKGTLQDANQAPIAAGNVLILSSSDSALLKGTYVLDGTYELEGLQERPFLLKFTALGYQDTTFLVTETPSNGILTLGPIGLEDANNLETVTVTSTVPTFKIKGGKVIVNVERSMLENSGTALDVLQRSPRVLVNANDEVQVFGKGSPVLLLDGQPTTVQELKSLPSNEIKEVEIVRNPSARYDAAGRAVINIITKRQGLEGYNGQAGLHLSHGRYFYGYGGLRLNYKKGKWSVGGSYWLSHQNKWSSNQYERLYNNDNEAPMRMFNQIEARHFTPHQHFYRFKIGFRPDSVSTVGFQYRGSAGNSGAELSNTNLVEHNGQAFNSVKAQTQNTGNRMTNSFNLNYDRTLDTLGSDLFIAGQYSSYTLNNSDDIRQIQAMPSDTQFNHYLNNSQTAIHLLNGQIDHTQQWTNHLQLESGAKGAAIFNQSLISFSEKDTFGKWQTNPNLTNSYRYNEVIIGAYTQLTYDHKKWYAQAGARGEWASMQGFEPSTNNQLLSRQYWHIFPTATLQYRFAKDWMTGIHYSTSIQRPSFGDLNPFVDFVDQYTIVRGNPYLVPAYTHSLEWSLSYLEMASLEVELARTFQKVDLFIQKEGDVFNIITKNYDQVDQLNISLNLPYENKWWTTYNALGFSYTALDFDRGNNLLSYGRPMFYVYSYNAFRIPKVATIEATFQYVSAGAEGYFSFKPFSQLGFSISRKFLNDKLSIRLNFQDVYFGYREQGNSLISSMDIAYRNLYDTRYVRLSMTYNFGQLKSTGLKDRSVNKSEAGRID